MKAAKKMLNIFIYKLFSLPYINVFIYALYVLCKAKNVGHFKSIRINRPVNRFGEPIPWITHGCINFFSTLDLTKLTMVEIGCGNSTIWFSNKVKEITSYEPNSVWVKEMKNSGYEGKIIHHQHDYTFTIKDLSADIIFIDGHDRISVLETIVRGINFSNLSPIFIIIDNSNWYPQAISTALELIDYIKIDFVGEVSTLLNESITTVLIARNADKAVFTNFEFFGFESLSRKRMGQASYDRAISL